MDINAVAAIGDLLQSASPESPYSNLTDRSSNSEKVVASPETVETDSSTPEQAAAAVSQIQQFTQALVQNLKFSIDEDTGKTVVKIVDIQTQEVIRQIPSEEAITIARTLGNIQGVLFNGQA